MVVEGCGSLSWLMSVDIRDSPMLDCEDIPSLKEVMHDLVFTTDCDDYGSWKQNYINIIVGNIRYCR